MNRDATDSEPQRKGDDELMAAHRAGDEAAARALFDRYYTDLIELVRNQMGEALAKIEESSDVVQSVFESVFVRGRAGTIEVGAEGRLWPLLVTITLNKIRNRARHWKRQRRDHHRKLPMGECDPLATDSLPEHAAEVKELVQQLLEQFSPRRQEIINLLLQDVPAEEIARRVGTSRRTVYHTRQAARKILKELLARS